MMHACCGSDSEMVRRRKKNFAGRASEVLISQSTWGLGARLFLLDPQLFEFGSYVLAMGSAVHFLVDVQNFSIGSNVKGPAEREFATFRYNTIGLCHGAARITENRVIQFQFLGEVSIHTCFITTGGKIGNVEFL